MFPFLWRNKVGVLVEASLNSIANNNVRLTPALSPEEVAPGVHSFCVFFISVWYVTPTHGSFWKRILRFILGHCMRQLIPGKSVGSAAIHSHFSSTWWKISAHPLERNCWESHQNVAFRPMSQKLPHVHTRKITHQKTRSLKWLQNGNRGNFQTLKDVLYYKKTSYLGCDLQVSSPTSKGII